MSTTIPLTRTFTPPPSCLRSSYTSYAPSIYVKDIKVESTECYPSGFVELWSQGLLFSPGVCPLSYIVASKTTSSGVTRELCCPSAMTARDGEMGCYSQVDGETTIVVPTGSIVVQDVLLAVHGILVAWDEDDASLFDGVTSEATTAPQAKMSSPSKTSAVKTDSSPVHVSTGAERPPEISAFSSRSSAKETDDHTEEAAMTQSPGGRQGSTSLPTSTLIGIVLGVTAAGAVIIALAVFSIRRQRRSRVGSQSLVGDPMFAPVDGFHDDERRCSGKDHAFDTGGSNDGRGGCDTLFEADSREVLGSVAEVERG
ncbi:hypothetical protein Q7P37_009208 [Cladosporium fusiforme]